VTIGLPLYFCEIFDFYLFLLLIGEDMRRATAAVSIAGIDSSSFKQHSRCLIAAAAV